MTLGRSQLCCAQVGFFLDESARNPDVAGHEHPKRELEIVEHASVKGLELLRTLLRESVVVLDLLRSKLHQVFVNYVAYMLKIDGKRNDLEGTAAVLIVEALPRDLGDEQLDRFIKPINGVVGSGDRRDQLSVTRHQRGDGATQHRFHNVAHVQRLARGCSERKRGC